VEADGAVAVTIDGNENDDGIEIGGNVEIKKSTGTIIIQDAEINGNVSLKKNTLDGFTIVRRNTVAGNEVEGDIDCGD